MKTALLVIDVQNDFCTGGALAVKDGEKIIPGVNRLLESNRYDLKVASLDWHPADHKSFASNNGAEVGSLGELNGKPQVMWPDHCIQDSVGADFHPDLKTEHLEEVVKKGENPEVDSYSAFFDNDAKTSTGLHALLQAYEIEAVEIVGLALDYCVKATALDAVGLGYQTTVVLAGTRAVNLKMDDAQRAIGELNEAGVVVSEEKI